MEVDRNLVYLKLNSRHLDHEGLTAASFIVMPFLSTAQDDIQQAEKTLLNHPPDTVLRQLTE